MENLMRLILEEIIMSDRHMSDGQLYFFFATFFQHRKNYLELKIG